MIQILALIICLLVAGPAGATTTNLADCSYSTVNTAVGSAGRGDTIRCPKGSWTWASTLTFTKGISLIGDGVDSTNITASSGQLINWVADSTAATNDETLEISGFTFDSANQTHSSGIIYIANNDVSHPMHNVKVHDNKFKNELGRVLYFIGPAWGVVYRNQYDRCQAVIDLFGTGQEGSIEWKQLTQEYGTINNLYFEDNSIYFSSSFAGYAGGDEVGQGARLVRRYNTWNETNAGGDELWDVHGLQQSLSPGTGQTCDAMATMVSEIYGNNVINYTGTHRWLNLRGGWNLTFNNSYQTVGGSGYFNYAHYGCDSCVYAANMGGLAAPWPVQGVNNTYLWSNFSNSSLVTTITSSGVEYCTGSPLAEDINWHISKGGTFNGTTGVGCGSSLPTGSCTQGVGFWLTNQSCSDVSPYVGSSITNPSRTNISGSLYKCGPSNNWVLAYTPYTYPHPLRSGTPGPGVSSSPISFDFGSVVVNASSAAKVFTLTNNGTGASLVIGSLSLTGTDSAQFSKGSDTCSSATLTAGQTCTFTGTFSPTSSGAKSGAVSVPSNVATLSIPLAGNGTVAAAQYSTDFSNYTTGSAPSDWTGRWSTANSTWPVAAGTGLGSKQLNGSQSTEATRLFSWNQIPTNEPNIEIRAKVMGGAAGQYNSPARILARTSGAAGTETGYSLYLAGTGTTLYLSKYVNGTRTTLGSYAVPWSALTWDWMVLRLNGSTITARAWADGVADPVTAQITVTDTDIPSGGWTGVGCTQTTDAPSVDYFSVGTGGASAPAPLTVTYTVTPSVSGSNGTISPATAQIVNQNLTTQFTVTPSANYSASVGGTCGGSLSGNVYTTNAVTADCTVIASFAQITFTVTPSAGANGSIVPATPQTINKNTTTTFTVTPDSGYDASVGGTCGGSLVGTTYTTNPINANCTVVAAFAATPITTYSVTPSAGANVTISPSGVQTVNTGAVATFTVTPSAGYTVAVAGTCGGNLSGTTYITNAVTGNCTVIASATIVTKVVTPSAGAGGTISPATAQTVAYGSKPTFTVTPNAWYSSSVAGTCGGVLLGITYTTDAITANCTVLANFTALPGASVSPISKNFGSILTSASSSATTFTVTNPGAANLVIGTTALADANADQFAIGTDTCNGQTIAPSGTCTIAVTFSPTTAGAKVASLSVPSNTTLLSIPLSGTGVDAVPPPIPEIQPSTYDFSVTILDGISVQTITITNTGGVNLVFGTLSLTGTNASDFGILNDTCSGQTVVPSANCTLRVSFSPAVVGTKSCTLNIPSNTTTRTVALTGQGVVSIPAPKGGGGHRGNFRFPW